MSVGTACRAPDDEDDSSETGVDDDTDGDDTTSGDDASPDDDMAADADGDGYLPPEDCRDDDPFVHPAAKEVCADCVDNDCDGQVDPDCPESDGLRLSCAWARFGIRIEDDGSHWDAAAAGDVNGDGLGDLVFGLPYDDEAARGKACVVYAPFPAGAVDVEAAGLCLVGEDWGHVAGWSTAHAGDLNADGFADLVIGAPGWNWGAGQEGGAYVFLGPLEESATLAEADAFLEGQQEEEAAGAEVAGAGDVDGDGFDDLLVGAPFHDGDHTDTGVAYLVRGPVSGQVPLVLQEARLEGERPSGAAGLHVAGAGDVNGDGYDDVLVGEPGIGFVVGDAGRAYLFYGPVSGNTLLSEADAIFYGTESIEQVGSPVGPAGDVNGDGYADVLVGAPGCQSCADFPDMGAAYLFYGPVEGGTFGRDDADAVLPARGGAVGSGQTAAVAGVGDADGDGYDDLWVGDPYGAEEAGTIVLLRGSDTAWEGVVSVGEAAFTWWGEHGIEDLDEGNQAGTLLAPAGDVDGDGLADVLIGAGQYWQGGVGVAIYLAVGSQIPWL